MEQPGWVKLADGVEVIRLWEIPPFPKTPEIAILRLSNARYEEFDDDPQGFHEKHKIFNLPFKLLRVDHMHAATKMALGRKSGSVIVASLHHCDTTSTCLSEVERCPGK
jgi:hypothetical protein